MRINTQHGMGGFLDPPGYPTHTHSIEDGPSRDPRYIGSIEHYAEPWIPAEIQEQAKALIDAWRANRPALESPEVQEWIGQVLGYFVGCYRGPGDEPFCWHADKLTIVRDPDYRRDHVADHAGVHLIRKYYPEFTPTDEDFARARWGNR